MSSNLSMFKHWTWKGRGRSKSAVRQTWREKRFSHRAMRRAIRTAERNQMEGSILIARGYWT